MRKMIYYIDPREAVCVVMEKMNGGDLLDYVISRPEKAVSERQSEFQD